MPVAAMTVVCLLILCGWSLLGSATAATSSKCGTSVYYPLARPSLYCLRTNATITTPAWAVLHLPGKVSTSLELFPGSPTELQPQPRGSTLRLLSTHIVCYHLASTSCKVGERERDIRDAHSAAEDAGHGHSGHELAVLPVALSVVALLVLPSIAVASFLCCPTGEKGSRTISNRRFSRKDRKSLTTSADISINITDSDHPLGSDNFTTFHKSDDDKPTSPLAAISVASSTHSTPSPLKNHSPRNTQHLLESSLDIGTRPESRNGGQLSASQHLLLESSLDIGPRPDSRRDGQQPGTSHSSMFSLGPRVPPDGSSLGNLSNIEKNQSSFSSSSHHLPPDMPPPPSIPPPPSHLRQNSTPASFPPPLPPTSPLQKPRPLTIIGQPTAEDSTRSAVTSLPPALPPKPRATPPLSPVSLSESEAMCSVRPGRVRPYRVVHQPSISLSSLSSLPHLPHSSDGAVCAMCGAKLTTGLESLVDTSNEELNDELCQQCQASDHNYQELELVDEDSLTSPPPIPARTGSPEAADPLYERIGSIRRHHLVSSISTTSRTYTSVSSDDTSEVTTTTFNPRVSPRLPAPSPIPSPKSEARATCSLPFREFSTCPLPSEGAPLPQRPPALGLRLEESPANHDYESLPSTFGPESPGDTLYARIPSPVEEEADTPPYIPENSQRAHMLKIDSQGYAEVVHKEEEESSTPDPDPSYSPLHPVNSPSAHAMASDYEVPVRIAPGPLLQQPPVTSPSFLLPSPSHSHPSPIPVPSPIPPTITPQPVSPSTHQQQTSSPTSLLTRQAAIAEQPLPVRSLQVLPGADRESLEDRRDSTGSVASYHLTFRLSTASSGLGESMTESLRAIAEEEEGTAEGGQRGVTRKEQDDIDPTILKQKIYEVENRSRTKSYPIKPPTADIASHKLKAQTMRMRIHFNKDSQAV